MNVDDISRLIELLDKSSIAELQWNTDGERLLLKKQGPTPIAPASAAPAATVVAAPVAASLVESPVSASPSADEGLVEVRSPMVGTFYRAASPETPNYVEEGGRVEKGKSICIIEAMKLMNEIESEVSGVVVKICVPNESPVEFGTVLFLVRPA